MLREPTIREVRCAARRIKPHIHHTPVLTSRAVNEMYDAEIFFKCENFQRAGAFKMRGATNAVFSLDDEEAGRGVTTHSSGNFAAALALAAGSRGIDAHVVMPRTAPQIKKDAVAGYGAEITYCEPTLDAREAGVEEVIERTGATFVHPYNDYRIIAGQGTAALELLGKIPDLEIVIAPVGGGGLLSGTAIAVFGISPMTRVVGAEPEMADDAFRSLKEGKILPSVNPQTISDGLLTSLGDLTFPIIQKLVEEIVTVSEEETISAMRCIYERMKIVVEPSAAVSLGALMRNRSRLQKMRIGIILSGGNVDLTKLPF
ncbi:MAG: pyridoxal-phosphate dependent enzyme [Deltaproteobacteria bacterium]|nr:pyridoxal-phosphate dependent enzyme [Deltaproteobacteria bacterium]